MKIERYRESNIELLRCFLMFLIVVQHFIAHNILSKDNPVGFCAPNFLSANLLLSFCVCSVDCFVLISGYFGIRFSIKKLTLFLLPILFYELMMSLVWYPYKHHISITFFNYWFVIPYVELMLLSPILNKGIKSLSKHQFQVVLFILILFFVLPINSISGNEGKNILIFIVLYFTGYYLRYYYIHEWSWGGYFIGYMVCSLFIFCEVYVLAYMGKSYDVQIMSYHYDNFFVYAASIFLFLAFNKIKLESKCVNWIAASSFFVYIISENENMYKRPFSFYDLIGVDKWNETPLYPFYILIASILVFISCIVIDKIRVLLFGRFEKLVGNIIGKYEE